MHPLLLLAALSADAGFEKHVRPVLVEHCLGCHGPKKQMGGLRLDSRAAALKGGDTGPAVVPGDENSLLLRAVRHAGDLKMPREKLPPAAIDALAAWVKAGAPWPDERPAASADGWKSHWAFRPIRRPPVPPAGDADTPLDAFLLARLREKGLRFAAPASDDAVRRRVAFALTGLPPEDRREPHERLVERLLASPRFGEHLARPWLDVARFADTKGYVFFEEAAYPWGWTYRDWLIEALNENLPYDRFITHQLAADLVPGADRRALRAMGFVTLGGRFMNNPHDILDDRIDAVTRGFLGLTVSCARCHDHKFDPLSAADYYALYGVFASSEEPPVAPEYDPTPTTEAYAKFTAELAKREKALADFLAEKRAALRRSAKERADEYLLAAHARRGQPPGDEFMLLADPNDLNPRMITRWQAAMTRAPRVWGPWLAFATKAAMPRDVNPLIRRLFVPAPRSIRHLASRYAMLFNEVDRTGATTDEEREVLAVMRGPSAAPDVTEGLFSELELLPDRAAQGVLQKLRKEVEQWRVSGPGAPPRAYALRDRASPYDPVVFRRGSPAQPGERVARRFPTFLGGREFRAGSGRRELAEAIASPDNPLTARVLVNRVWQHHFGRGLVETSGDFGLRSSPPTHPELLDWLAAEFIASGWDVKHVHRLICTSRVYRQGGGPPPKADPENRLLSVFPRRRLSFEELRDALLVVGGRLDGRIGGPSVAGATDPGVRRRTVYSHVDRISVPGLFRAFDFPSPDASSSSRDATLVPQQALFLMNSPFALDAARGLAARGDVRTLYQACYGRPPTPAEAALAEAFAAERERYAQALLLANEFSFVD